MIGAIILGLLAGFIGKALVPGKDPGGFFATILIGLAGSLSCCSSTASSSRAGPQRRRLSPSGAVEAATVGASGRARRTR